MIVFSMYNANNTFDNTLINKSLAVHVHTQYKQYTIDSGKAPLSKGSNENSSHYDTQLAVYYNWFRIIQKYEMVIN